MLDDLLAPNLKIVFCGTAAGAVSATRGLYYAGPGNKFWPILHKSGLTPHQLSPNEFRSLLQFGLGLTDVVKGQSGSDADIDFGRSDPQGLTEKLLKYQPRVLAFNGKKAAQVFFGKPKVEFGLQPKKVGETHLYVAPSTSGAANGHWDENLWIELAALANSAVTEERA